MKIVDIAQYLTSEKSRVRQDGMAYLVENFDTVLPTLGDNPRIASKLIRGLCQAIGADAKDIQGKAAPTNISITRLRKSAAFFRELIEPLIDHCEAAAVKDSPAYRNALKKAPKENPVENTVVLAKSIARDVVPHVLASIETGGKVIVEPLSKPYSTVLSRIVQSHIVRSYLSPEHIHALFALCMRHLRSSFEEPAGPHARTKSKAPHILSFATTFSRLLLIFPAPLTSISGEIQLFFHQFLVGPRTDTILPHTLLSGLNYYLLRVANSQSDHLFNFLTSATMDLTSWWADSATIQLPKFPALRRESLVFFRLALFLILGESTDDEHTMPALLPMADKFRTLWKSVTVNLRRGTTGTWLALKAAQTSLQWPRAGKLGEAEAAAAAAGGLELPPSPLFPSVVRVLDAAFVADRGECVLEAWNSVWVASEVFVRVRQLETAGRELPAQPLEAAAGERPSQRKKAMTTLDEVIDILTSGSKDDEYAPSFICQLLMLITMRYPKLWTSSEYSTIVAALASTLNVATKDEAVYWACACLSVLLAHQPPISAESAVLARPRSVAVWFRIHGLLLRRLNRSLSEPVFHLLLAMHLHLSVPATDLPRLSVPPTRIFSPDTALTPSVLRFATLRVCVNSADWSIMDWVSGALDWLLGDTAALAACAKTDARAVMGFMYAVCGDFARALQEIAHQAVPVALPVDEVIVEHELVGFMVAGRCLYDGVLPTPVSLDFEYEVPAARPDYVVRETVRTLLARMGTVMESLAEAGTDMLDDSSMPAMVSVACQLAHYGGMTQVIGPQALEAHACVTAAAALVNRLGAHHLALADLSAHMGKLKVQLDVLMEMARLVGLDGMRLDRYLSLQVTKSSVEYATADRLQVFAFGPVRQALLKSFQDINKLLANVVNLESGNASSSSEASSSSSSLSSAAAPKKSLFEDVGLAFDIVASDSSKDTSFASFVSVVAQSHHNAHDHDLRLANCVGHVSATFMATYAKQGLARPHFLLDEDKLASTLVQGIVCLMRLPTPAMDLFAELLEAHPHLVPPAHADWLFTEAYDRLEASAKDPVLGTDCMTVARISFPGIAALTGTAEWTSDKASDLSDFFQFFMDRCGRTHAHSHFKVAIAKFIVSAARARIAVAKADPKKIDTALTIMASDSIASVRLGMIQFLPLLLDTADSPNDLAKTARLLAPPMPPSKPEDPDAMDVDGPKPSFEEFVVPVLYYARLAVVSEFLRTGALVDLVQHLRDERCACNPTQVMDMITAIIGPSLSDFLNNYVPAMLFCFASKGMDLLADDFPYELVTRAETRDQYLERFMTHVVVALAFHHKLTEPVLAQLAPIANTSVNSLMVRHFAILYSSVLPKYYGTPEQFEEAKKTIEFVYRLADGSDQQWASIQDTVLSRLFLHTRDDFHRPDYVFPSGLDLDLSEFRGVYETMLPATGAAHMKPCFYARNQPEHSTVLLAKTLIFLADQHKLPLNQMIAASNLLVLLRSLHVNLEGSVDHPQEHAHWLHVYRLVLSFTNPLHLQQSFVFKLMVSSLLHLIPISPLKSEVLHILNRPFAVIDSYMNSPYLLSQVVPILAHALITHKEVQPIASSLIDTLLVYHDKYTLHDPAAFPPFPENQLLEGFAARRQEYLARRGLKESASVLIQYLSTMPDNESIKSRLAPLVREGLLRSEAVKLTKVIVDNKCKSATDIAMLGQLFPTLFSGTEAEAQAIDTTGGRSGSGSAGVSRSASTSSVASGAPAAAAKQLSPLEIIVKHLIRCMNESKDFDVLQECAHLLRSIPQDQTISFLDPTERDMIAIAPPTIPKFNDPRVLPAEVPPELANVHIWDSSSVSSTLAWIRPLITRLVRCQPVYILQRVERLMRLDEELAVVLFPYVVDSFASARPEHAAILADALSHVFKNADSQHLGVLSLCLDVLKHMRVLQREAAQETSRPALKLNYLDVARAAFRCKRTYEAMAFAERHGRMQSPEGVPDEAANDLLMRAYQEVDDPDGIYGVNMGTSLNHLLATYEHEKDWFNALTLMESQLSVAPSSERPSEYRKCMATFEALGLHRLLADMSLQPGSTAASNIDEAQYQSLWRNFRWDVQATPSGSLAFHGHLFEVTRALHENQPMQVSQWVRSGLDTVASEIHVQALNASQVVTAPAKFDALLHAFVLSGFSSGTSSQQALLSSPSRSSNSLEIAMREQFKSWDMDMPQLQASLPFDKVDLLLSVRTAVNVAINAPAKERFSTLMDHAVAARKARQFQTAMSVLTQLEPLAQDSADRWAVLEQRARLHWAKGDHRFALRVLDEIIKGHQHFVPPNRMAKILKRAGQWYSELKLLPAATIVESYLAKATKISPNYSGAFHALAQFAHRQYKDLSESETLTKLESQIATYRRDLHTMAAVQWPENNPPSDYRQRINKLQQQITQDRAEVKIMREQCSVYVRTAVDNYMQALATSDQHDLDVYSLCSLWLSTAHDDKLNHIVMKRLHHVPPSKFICLVNQLTARLGCELDEGHEYFKRTLYAVVQYVLVNHPHHILYNLIALSNGDVIGYRKDEYLITDDLDESVKARTATVGKLLDDFKVKHPLIFEQYQQLTEAYIEASYRPIQLRSNVSTYPLTGFKIAKIRNLEGVPVATAHIGSNVGPVRVDDTPFPPHIHRFQPDCSIPGGVNQPKAIKCLGSDGIIYKQLVKGNDDLRQDAGLMHVFQVADQLLDKHEATRTRQLSIRTYKVIPLAPQAGLLEWVDNTRPLYSVLSDLHGQWAKVDGVRQMSHLEARKKLGSVQASSPQDKIRVFKDEILPKFRPVLHNWFLAQDTAEEWFNKRLAFTRSLAVTSIVGYIVGLGDRHPSNILFDERTATLIHIDLGISFDAGSLLPIPEVVPFRLTQNLVDAMGPAGVEGVFRRSCEETLRVLRLESHVLYTILEVFKYDPLHNWTDPQKMARAQAEQAGLVEAGTGAGGRQTRAKSKSQTGADEEVVLNKEAERALTGVRRKLGHRDSVECQVSELIQEATSKENLAVLFQGWQPYF